MMNERFEVVYKTMKWTAIVLALLIGVFGGCQFFNKQLNLEDDHPLEQYVEDVIEDETGIEIDLTP